MEGLTEEALFLKRLLVSAVGHEVLVSEKKYVKLLQSLSCEGQGNHTEGGATTWQLDECNGKVGELELNVRLRVDEAGQVGEIK